MASVVNRPNGHRWIQFKCPDGGKRRTIRLGKVDPANAQDVKRRIEALIVAKSTGSPLDPTTAHWLSVLPRQMYDKLAAVMLVEPRPVVTLGELVEAFEKASSVGDTTRGNRKVGLDNLKAHFGSDRTLSDITRGDASEFRSWLLKSGGKKGGKLAPATVSRRCGWANELFGYAAKKHWIRDNPFEGFKRNEINRERDFFVTREVTDLILAKCQDPEFKAIVALSRYGGLRCPSEVLQMSWDRFNWEDGTFEVRKQKTAFRNVPLWDEVHKAVDELWDHADENQPLLFPNHQVTNAALTDKLRRVCRTAGMLLWDKPWQNMRASRETELTLEHPIHIVAYWLGNSPTIALQHYNQIVKEHTTREAGQKRASPSRTRSKAKQNPKLP